MKAIISKWYLRTQEARNKRFFRIAEMTAVLSTSLIIVGGLLPGFGGMVAVAGALLLAASLLFALVDYRLTVKRWEGDK